MGNHQRSGARRPRAQKDPNRGIYTEQAVRSFLPGIMALWHVIAVYPDGTIADASEDISAPDVYWDDGKVDYGDGDEAGWSLLQGFSETYDHIGPLMHASERVDGELAAHIRATPGHYACVAVLDLDSDPALTGGELDDAGWAVAYRKFPEGTAQDAGCDRCGTYDRAPGATLCRDCRRDELRERLRSLEAAFEHNGGRGVELAEEIDALRAQLGENESGAQDTSAD